MPKELANGVLQIKERMKHVGRDPQKFESLMEEVGVP
jgi:hypothetical protein